MRPFSGAIEIGESGGGAGWRMGRTALASLAPWVAGRGSADGRVGGLADRRGWRWRNSLRLFRAGRLGLVDVAGVAERRTASLAPWVMGWLFRRCYR
ncbi:MAG: hypothetical protein IPK50_09045 [Fibrobacterota bacterium]|nr:hypothetical protein [Fibrobacterota bacterium]QQS07023.1 MAG: hypothetical protein IPK50_09045 [Fibrobacterota bacterium]